MHDPVMGVGDENANAKKLAGCTNPILNCTIVVAVVGKHHMAHTAVHTSYYKHTVTQKRVHMFHKVRKIGPYLHTY